MRLYCDTFDRARYNDAYLLGCVSEATVQKNALATLNLHRIPALAVDAGGAKLRGRACRALRGAGVRNAAADDIAWFWKIALERLEEYGEFRYNGVAYRSVDEVSQAPGSYRGTKPEAM
ncbi:MAG: hypothetical protein ACLQLH_03365 [Terracidiphilus sp.]